MKKRLLFIILGFTLFIIVIIFFFKFTKRFNEYVISDSKWNEIIGNRSEDSSISLEGINFNDYGLLIDDDVIYYSIVNFKMNPSVKFFSDKGIKLAFNKKIGYEDVETDNVKVLLYNDQGYKVYSLYVTNFPILNVVYKGNFNNKGKIDIELELFDNHVDSSRRLLKSFGKFEIIEDNKKYSFSLVKESPGHNERENYISIFGMPSHYEYYLNRLDEDGDFKCVQFFINNKYMGMYLLDFNERKGDNFERNKENNK